MSTYIGLVMYDTFALVCRKMLARRHPNVYCLVCVAAIVYSLGKAELQN